MGPLTDYFNGATLLHIHTCAFWMCCNDTIHKSRTKEIDKSNENCSYVMVFNISSSTKIQYTRIHFHIHVYHIFTYVCVCTWMPYTYIDTAAHTYTHTYICMETCNIPVDIVEWYFIVFSIYGISLWYMSMCWFK